MRKIKPHFKSPQTNKIQSSKYRSALQIFRRKTQVLSNRKGHI